MIWQDAVFGIGSIGFVVALIPTALGKWNKPALSTSLATSSILSAFAIAYMTLDLTFAAWTACLTAGLWYLIAYQTWQQQTAAKLQTAEVEGSCPICGSKLKRHESAIGLIARCSSCNRAYYG